MRRLLALLWRVRIGRCGPVARVAARWCRRALPVRGIVSVTHSILGVPPAGAHPTVVATVGGNRFRLDLADGLHRMVYLDEFDVELRRVVLPLLRPGDLVVDVGANFGFWTVAAAGRGAEVDAVEPVPPTRQLLEENVERNGYGERVRVVAGGVSDRLGELTIVVPAGESGHASAYAGAEPDAIAFRVPVTTLDELVGDRSVRLLKVDVEGHERAVLRGGRSTFAAGRVEYVLIELVEPNLRRADSSVAEIVDLMTAAGFRLVRFVTENEGFAPRRRRRPTNVAEIARRGGDALFVHVPSTPT